MSSGTRTGEFVFEQKETIAKGSALYSEHIKLTDKSHIAAFAGFLMPLWYTSISAEHQAVREAAGLFDCSHMGVLEAAGPYAKEFLNIVFTNDVNKLSDGKAQYGYIIDAAGNVLDDIIIYRRAEDKYMVVVNASNEPKIKAYFNAMLNDEAIIDADNADRRLDNKPAVRDMRDVTSGSDCRIDLALQGPEAIDIVLELIEDEQIKGQIKELKPFRFIETAVAGIDCIVSRTGYTGAAMGFELYVHPDKAPELWSKLFEKGKSSGLVPCGLGARDSLRIEAGFPLYGHELAGPFNISPFQAGYSFAVKLDKEFFIGKAAMQEEAERYNMAVVRIELPGAKGIRPVRGNDAVLDDGGDCVGWVLSCAKVSDKQIVLALVSRDVIKEGETIGVYYLARKEGQVRKGRKQEVKKGQNVQADITGITLSRFAKF